ncbi:GrlR family regulatory protein [Agrobacterium vitis]
MQNGLYKVVFKTPLGVGAGVIFAQDGKMWGGDSGIYYIGTYTDDNGNVAATVETNRHFQPGGTVSVFGVDKVTINLVGRAADNVVQAQGSSPQAPNISFSATLTRIED